MGKTKGNIEVLRSLAFTRIQIYIRIGFEGSGTIADVAWVWRKHQAHVKYTSLFLIYAQETSSPFWSFIIIVEEAGQKRLHLVNVCYFNILEVRWWKTNPFHMSAYHKTSYFNAYPKIIILGFCTLIRVLLEIINFLRVRPKK